MELQGFWSFVGNPEISRYDLCWYTFLLAYHYSGEFYHYDHIIGGEEKIL